MTYPYEWQPPRQALDEALDKGWIDLEKGPAARAALAQVPTPLPRDPDALRDKVEGMMLGLAIGDALCRRSEGMRPAARRARFGEVRDYPIHARAGYERRGVPSDDTQLAFWTLEHLVNHGQIVPPALLDLFAQRRIKGMGGTVREAIRQHQLGVPWYQTGPASAGNGAIMRMAPILLPYLTRPSADLWAEVALAAMVTHNDAGSTAACIAWTAMLWDLLGMTQPPAADWWMERYIAWAQPLEGEYRTYHPRGGQWHDYYGALWAYVQMVVAWADEHLMPVVDACNAWYSGAFLMETLPCVIYILMRHAHDPEEAIVRAVNDTKDNDTVASLVATAVGALHGAEALPARWRANLTGRTRAEEDAADGQVQALIDMAWKLWGPS